MSDPKETLRDQARKHRVLTDIRDENVEDATDFFFDIIKPKSGQVIAGYWPKGREFDPTAILERALNEGFTCALPVVEEGTRILKFIKWDQSVALEKGAYGIMEPQSDAVVEPDILLIPMLAFDRKGIRLGQGGGYYDATLETLRNKKTIQAVGVAYASQAVLFTLPVEEHDQKMDYILTPQGITRY